MKFKIGDKVRVKTLEEILEDPNTIVMGNRIVTSYFIEENGELINIHDALVEDMKKMCGKCFTISQVNKNKHLYILDGDSMYYDWLECWLTEPYCYIDSFLAIL